MRYFLSFTVSFHLASAGFSLAVPGVFFNLQYGTEDIT